MGKRFVYGIITLALAGLIVYTSLNTGNTYSSIGGRIGAWVNAVFFGSRLNAEEVLTITSFGAKFFGHFSLFALEGLFAFLFCGTYKNKWLFAAFFLVFGMFMSVLGESIQLFIDGRSPSFEDVWIDFSGYLLLPIWISFYRKLNRS